MSLLFRLIVLYCIALGDANVTKFDRSNVLLSRRKRYLTFPKGSNLVISFSGVKSIMQVQPKGWNILVELDFPFALPSDTRLFAKHKNKKRHEKERRDVYSTLELGFTENGFNGTACVRRMACDAQKYIPEKGKSLVKDLLLALFTYEYLPWATTNQNMCDDNMWVDCSVSFLDYVLQSVQGGNGDTTNDL